MRCTFVKGVFLNGQLICRLQVSAANEKCLTKKALLLSPCHDYLPYNGLPFLVTYGASSALSRRFADNTSK